MWYIVARQMRSIVAMKNCRRAMSAFAALCAAVVSASATAGVCKIGNTEYDTLHAAVLAKRHIGATNGLDWRMYAGRISGLEKEIAKRRKFFDAKIKALFA